MTRPRRKAFTLVQLILAVFVMGVFIRIVFHVGDAPHVYQANHDAAVYKYHGPYLSKLEKFQDPLPAMPEADAEAEETTAVVVPFKPLHADRDRGPLLARILRQHRPATDAQIDGLVDTLPPNASPSVIVIIPSVEKPETPDVEKSCPGYVVVDEDAEDEAEETVEDEGTQETADCCSASSE